MNKFSKVLWGFVLIFIGVLVSLKIFDVLEFNLFFRGWWTLFIIVPCFIGLFNNNESKTGNIIGLVIGCALLCSQRGFIPFDIIVKLIVPFVLIVIGLSFIFGDIFKKTIIENVEKKVKDMNVGKDGIVATFTDQKVNFDGEEFEGKAIDCVFGGVTLDLRESKISKDAGIKVSCIFGGVNILVPNDVNVKVNSNSIFGGVSNKVRNNPNNKKTVYVDAFVLFGGVDIK